ncbi:MAG: hypothetical protein ACREUR_11565 [Nitrosospira sp.]
MVIALLLYYSFTGNLLTLLKLSIPDPNKMASKSTPPDPRQEIVEYLRAHPSAADTVDGIILYWLGRQRYETAKDTIERALEDLVLQGVIEYVATGEKKVFRLAKNHRESGPTKTRKKPA